MRTIVFGLTIAVFATACSLGALDGFSGGGAAADGGGGGDGAVNGDGGADGAAGTDSATDAPSSDSFCSTRMPAPSACADFDDGSVPLPFSLGVSGKSTATIETGGVGGTKGMRLVVPANATDTDSSCLRMTIPAGRSSVVVEMEANVGQVGTDDFDLVVLSSDVHEVGFHLVALGQLEIEEDDGVNTYFPSAKRLDATYHRLRFVVTSSDAGARSELFVDDVSAVTHVADARALGNATIIEIGDCNISVSRGWTVSIDNVVVDLK